MPVVFINYNLIFSTHVEMNQLSEAKKLTAANFLYARGDEPAKISIAQLISEFSLRTWR